MSLFSGKQLKGKGIYVLEICEKFIIHLTKVLLSVLEVHPFSFINLIRPSLEFTFYYLFTDEGINFLFERFIIQCFNLMKNIFLCVEYKPPKVLETTKHEETLQAYNIKQDFFTPDAVSDMCRKLIGHYFILTKDELETWDVDPETFCNDESGDSWKYSLRVSLIFFHEQSVKKVTNPDNFCILVEVSPSNEYYQSCFFQK